jgi:hypothetical protein
VREAARLMFRRMYQMHDFDPESPETFRNWRTYLIKLAVSRNAVAPEPVSVEEAENIGERCAIWYWQNYAPEAYKKTMQVRKQRPAHELIESIVDRLKSNEV